MSKEDKTTPWGLQATTSDATVHLSCSPLACQWETDVFVGDMDWAWLLWA